MFSLSQLYESLVREWRRYFLIILLLVFPLFFIGGPDYYDPRSLKEVWNLGHFFFFAMFGFVLDSYCCSTRRSIFFRIFATFLIVVIVGLGIELVQLHIADRYFSLSDIARDLSGGVTALLWRIGRRFPPIQLTVCRIVSIIIVLFNLFPLGIAFTDEIRGYNDFPLLAGFESKAELSRWGGGGVGFCLVSKPRVQGRFSGKITLTTDEYSGMSLHHFPGDWSGMSGLAFNVFNPGQPLSLHYRIHDHLHRGNNQTYEDRYNGTTVLEPGWNAIVIPLTDIINGPQGRKLDVARIRGFGAFVMNQPDRRVLYLDNVRLL